jgi:hypothetical protein
MEGEETKAKTQRRNKGVRYELYFTEDVDRRLREIKERTGNPAASFIRTAVIEALDRDKAPAGSQ